MEMVAMDSLILILPLKKERKKQASKQTNKHKGKELLVLRRKQCTVNAYRAFWMHTVHEHTTMENKDQKFTIIFF